MQEIMDGQRMLEQKRLSTQTRLQSVSARRLDPVTCKHCGVDLAFMQIMGVSLSVPVQCECPGASAEREQEEQARTEEEERAARTAKEDKSRKTFARIFRQACIPERFESRTFDNFTVQGKNDMVRRAFIVARNYQLSGKGLLFFGPPGTGKTHLAVATARRIIDQGKPVVFGTVPALLARVRETYNDGSRENEAEVMQALCQCSLLVMDDLGKEKVTDWVEERIYEIINTRYERNLPIIATMNIGFEGLEQRYPWNGKAIVSRLFEMCQGVMMDGDDFRMQK